MTKPRQGERDDQPVVSLTDITKRFSGVVALSGVSLDLYGGEVHVLLGENGAGKSTLVNVMIGTLTPEEGHVAVHGRRVTHHSPAHARQEGINAVLQDFSLAPSLSVVDNLFLGREVTRFGVRLARRMRNEAAQAVRALGVDIDVDAPVGTLNRAEQQIVEIVKALQGRPGALLLDEPTAALTQEETHRLFGLIEQLKKNGWAILYITHRLEEVRRLGDRVTILRDGYKVATYPRDAVADSQLIQDMVGRALGAVYPEKRSRPEATLLRVDRMTSLDRRIVDVSLHVRAGEIVGIAGLVGSGRSEVGRAIFGLLPVANGVVEVDGTAVRYPEPRRMLQLGLVYMPDDRRGQALALSRPIKENVILEVLGRPPHSRLGLVRPKVVDREVSAITERLDVRPKNIDQPVGRLSGGNQQKVVLARALTRPRRVYIFDDPTVGVDIGTRQELYARMRGLCDQGAAILLISSDLEEVVHVPDRVYVMHRGRVQAELAGAALTAETVVSHSFGHSLAEGL